MVQNGAEWSTVAEQPLTPPLLRSPTRTAPSEWARERGRPCNAGVEHSAQWCGIAAEWCRIITVYNASVRHDGGRTAGRRAREPRHAPARQFPTVNGAREGEAVASVPMCMRSVQLTTYQLNARLTVKLYTPVVAGPPRASRRPAAVAACPHGSAHLPGRMLPIF